MKRHRAHRRRHPLALQSLEPRQLFAANPYILDPTHAVQPRADGRLDVISFPAGGGFATQQVTVDAADPATLRARLKPPVALPTPAPEPPPLASPAPESPSPAPPVDVPPTSPAPPPPPPALPPTLYDWHTATVDGILHVWAPDPADFGQTWTANAFALYGDNNLPDPVIQQGPLANCYFLAAEDTVARTHPDLILSRIQWDGDGGGFAVTFDSAYSSRRVTIHTAATLSLTLHPGQTSDVWWQAGEKAYAAFRSMDGPTIRPGASLNTMASTGTGNGGVALNNFGFAAYTLKTPDAIAAAVADGRPVDVHTLAGAPDLVPSHVYAVVSAEYTADGGMAITLSNPWGFTQTIGFDVLARNWWGYVYAGLAR